MNQLNITGNLTRDPEQRTTNNGQTVTHFCVAVNGMNDEVEYFNCSAFGANAENVMKYVKKGNKVLVTGSVRSRAFTRNDGSVGATCNVNVNRVEFLTSIKRQEETTDGFEKVEEEDDELPF